MAKVSVTYDDAELRNNTRNFSSKLKRNLDAVLDYNAAYATGYLKENAPWHDNTGAARTGLMAIPHSERSVYEIFMAYSVTYGIWLEIANSGRYAVITPAMRILGTKLMRDMQYLIDRMGSIR